MDALWSALSGNRFAGEALIDAANNLVASKTGGASAVSAAKAIYQRLYAANVPSQIRGAALMRLTMADSVGVERLLADALTGNDAELQHAAVIAVTDYWYLFDSSNRRSEKIVALLPRVTPAIRARLVGALNASAERKSSRRWLIPMKACAGRPSKPWAASARPPACRSCWPRRRTR